MTFDMSSEWDEMTQTDRNDITIGSRQLVRKNMSFNISNFHRMNSEIFTSWLHGTNESIQAVVSVLCLWIPNPEFWKWGSYICQTCVRVNENYCSEGRGIKKIIVRKKENYLALMAHKLTKIKPFFTKCLHSNNDYYTIAPTFHEKFKNSNFYDCSIS